MSNNETPAGDTRKCPHCAEWIKSEAVVCRYCGRDVTPTVKADTEAQATSESDPPEETSTSKRKPWLLLAVLGAGVAVAVGVIVIVALTRSPYGVPEVDAVAETWEEAGPEFRKDTCNSGLAVRDVGNATLEANPNAFLDDDVYEAANWFLKSGIGGIGLYLILERGVYVSSEYTLESEAELKREFEEEFDTTYLGRVEPVPDPCVD